MLLSWAPCNSRVGRTYKKIVTLVGWLFIKKIYNWQSPQCCYPKPQSQNIFSMIGGNSEVYHISSFSFEIFISAVDTIYFLSGTFTF